MWEFKFESKPAKKYKRQQSNCFNKYYTQAVSKPFFLTRQSANLMEDFARELNQGSALFFLYGESGVGKTRLLRELIQSRLSDRAIYWLDLDPESGNDETRMDPSAEIEALFAAAGNGDIIIADHFEIALKKSRHQLFLSWSTDGVDKQLNLIISSSAAGLDELRQLSQQYQVQVQSFEQMPFSAEEVQSFLGFYLFPDQPTGKLTIASSVRKQIAGARGNVGQLIDIAEREGSQIISAVTAQVEPTRQGGRMIYALMLLLVLALGAGWYLLGQPDFGKIPGLATFESDSGTIEQSAPETVVAVEVPAQPEPPLAMEIVTTNEAEAESTRLAEMADSSETSADPVAEIAQQPAPALEPVETTAAVLEQSVESATQPSLQLETDTAEADVAETAQVQFQQSEPGTVSDSEAVMDESLLDIQPSTAAATEVAVVEAVQVPASSQARFEFELQQSMNWIGQRDDTVGTIQILLLSYENFNADNYYEYVANLAQRGADTTRLRVFKTYTGNREVYSVVYDEFASRKAAIAAIGALPAVLRDASPLGRSVGGLWQEIRRLEAKN